MNRVVASGLLSIVVFGFAGCGADPTSASTNESIALTKEQKPRPFMRVLAASISLGSDVLRVECDLDPARPGLPDVIGAMHAAAKARLIEPGSGREIPLFDFAIARASDLDPAFRYPPRPTDHRITLVVPSENFGATVRISDDARAALASKHGGWVELRCDDQFSVRGDPASAQGNFSRESIGRFFAKVTD